MRLVQILKFLFRFSQILFRFSIPFARSDSELNIPTTYTGVSVCLPLELINLEKRNNTEIISKIISWSNIVIGESHVSAITSKVRTKAKLALSSLVLIYT